MKFTLSWLKDHLDTDLSHEIISKALVECGLEVESITDTAARYNNFVLGHIQSIRQHPNAERLNLCTVDIGSAQPVEVVCGAPNVRSGMKIAYAKVGATIPASGDILKPAKIRGIESCGMLCSEEELGLSSESNGIMDLNTSEKPGTPIAQVFGNSDVIFDISITPNRSDCFSIYGIARDLAAKGCGTLKALSPIKEYPEESISPDAAMQFFTGHIKGAQNLESPTFIQERLKSVGMNPKNFLVDITNYIAIDLGQPLHIHDASAGINVSARLAKTDEILVTLKEQEIQLSSDDIVVTSNDRPSALAGIMGSMVSSVTEHTTDIILEAAQFNPTAIAFSGQRHHIHSESRLRFERGIDPEMTSYAFYHTLKLVLEHCGGTVESIKSKRHIPEKHIIDFEIDTFTKICGFSIDPQKAKKHLEDLGFIYLTPTKLQVPLFRHDVTIKEDIVEELLRMEGLDHIPSLTLPLKPLQKIASAKQENLINRGMDEVYTWSMISENEYSLFSKASPVYLNNPLNINMAVMRPTLLTGLLKSALENQNKGASSVAFFEHAKIYTAQGEHMMLSGLRSGQYQERSWYSKARNVDIFDIKADCLSVLPDMKMQLTREAPDYYHPTKSGCFKQGKNIIAYFGELHPTVVKTYGLKGAVVAFEIFLERIPNISKKTKMGALSPYPSVPRDLCFVMDKSIMVGDVLQAIQKIDPNLIHDVSVFDIYEKDETMKSVAIEFFYQSNMKTLDEQEIQGLTETIIKTVTTRFSAQLRT